MDLTGDFTDEYIEIYRDYFKSVERIGYYIHDEYSKVDHSSVYSWSHHDGHETVIQKAFDDIDSSIDLDFYETNNVLEAQIHIYEYLHTSASLITFMGLPLGAIKGLMSLPVEIMAYFDSGMVRYS